MYTAIVTPGNPHPVVIYGRVSQLRDERSKSVDDQLDDLRVWADREGWPIVAEHRDDGISASRFAKGKVRDGWQQVLDVITSGQVKALLVWELSRASRDKRITAALEAACVAAGVRIGYHGQLHDPATSSGEFHIGLDGLLAARQSAETSEKVMRASISRAARGAPHCGLSFGYTRVLSPVTGQTVEWIEHPEDADIVREIVRRILSGRSANSVARALNEFGVPSARGGKWSAVTVALVAQRPAYAALRVHRGEISEVRGNWPAIISEADHHRVAALYADPARPRHPKNVTLLGVGIFRCGKPGCDGRMEGWMAKGRPPAYKCRACGGCFIAREGTDEVVRQAVVAFLSRPDFLAHLTADSEGSDVAQLEVVRLRRKVNELETALNDDEITVAQFTRLTTAAEAKLADAERRARPQHLPAAVFDVAGPQAASRWKATGLVERRSILDALFEVVIRPGRIGTKGFDPTRVQVEPKKR